ncbi:hypothetical protein KSS93_09525 [Pseudomonas xanthosomatis]|uniref:hypothetical protein n=1 Tax=Pseudomonas xanthosomatis TaxID=2842356 RepID=UPI001C3DE876|nr:hypothetical protein [Pseudomonas xanthosomatis]QXH48126.1 hypothetical protein KSS93_09525 [Pseudomonas xanthosomatis]
MKAEYLRFFSDRADLLDVKGAIAIAKLAIGFMSLGMAHYMGFLWSVPFEVTSLVSSRYVVSFVGVFTFYVASCYYLTRAITFSISQFYYCFIAPLVVGVFGANRLARGKLRRSARRMYRETTMAERIIYWVFFLPMFPFFLNFAYLKFNYEMMGAETKLLGGFLLLAAVLRSGVLNRPSQIFRIFDKKRVALRRRLLKDYAVFFAGVTVVISFYAGVLRYEKILHEEPVWLKSEMYQGDVRMLLNAGGDFLVVEDEFFVSGIDGVLVKLKRK